MPQPPTPPPALPTQSSPPRGWHPAITIITGLVMLGLGMLVGYFYGFGKMMMTIESDMRELLSAPTGEIQVVAMASKYKWHFHYPGADGEFGSTSLQNWSESNPVGLDFEDPRSQDDIITQELVLPCDTQVEVITHSADVIHALGNLHGDFALDATPGINERAPLVTPAAPTSGTLRCVQLCGAGHKDHHAPYQFVASDEFEEWLAAQPTVAETTAQSASAR